MTKKSDTAVYKVQVEDGPHSGGWINALVTGDAAEARGDYVRRKKATGSVQRVRLKRDNDVVEVSDGSHVHEARPYREYADSLLCGGTYMARTFRLREEDPGVLPPFVPTRLHVQHHGGQAVSVTTMDYDWAEADPRQEASIGDGVLTLVAEDYRLDIEISSIPR